MKVTMKMLLVHNCTLLCTFYWKNLDFLSLHPEIHNQYIYTTTGINFTNLSVTTEMGALYGRLICGWLGVVVARKTDLNLKL